MHFLSIFHVIGSLVLVLGLSQLIPLGMSLLYEEADWSIFLVSSLGAIVLGGGMMLLTRTGREISDRDGFFVVTLGWIAAALVGAIPFLLTGAAGSITDAMFESMSGFTTTGASIFTEYTDKSHGIMLWRSMTQWFGGMGIIVLALVILPALGIGGMQLYKREVPGPYSEKLTPRLRDTAKALWSVYLGLTILETGVLYALGLSLFDAVNHALTTVATAGFSTRGASVGAFDSAAVEWAIIVFMIIGGTNFSLHYRMLIHRKPGLPYFKDVEWRWYMGAIVVVSITITLVLVNTHGYDFPQALTKSTFQVVSILTTTGYVTDDYVQWGAFPQILFVFMMITGGCAGSTSGGVKWVRILLVFKYIYMELLRLVHPRVIIHAKINNTRVTPDILSNIFAFLFLFLTTLAGVTLLLALDGHSILTSVGAAVSALANIGPGLDVVGPTGNFHHFSDYAKWVMIIAMLMGRLELMTVFVLFMPHVWRQ